MKIENFKEILEWNKILETFESLAETSAGKKSIREIKPLKQNQIKNTLTQISEIKLSILENYEFHFSGIRDISDYCRRAVKGSDLLFNELYDIRQTIIGLETVKKFISKNKDQFSLLLIETKKIISVPDLQKDLTESITENCELNLNKYPNILKLEKELSNIQNEIVKKINSLFRNKSYEHVFQENIHDIRSGRYVVLIKSNSKGKLKGNVLDVSSSGATLYLEPDVISQLNTELIMKKVKHQNEIQKILTALTILVKENAEELLSNQTIISQLDKLKAAAKYSLKINANEFLPQTKPVINLYTAKNPLLLQYQDEVIPNDISLNSDKCCMIISGANTGGKTVLLKTVGLIVLMAIHGMHVPASPDSQIGYFDSLMADIGDDQNMSESLSTFSGQITKINDILKHSSKSSLVLIDEIMSGTDPRRGAILASEVIKAIAKKGALVMVTTHYFELTKLPLEDPHFLNASVSFDTDIMKPTYLLHRNIPGSSYTLEIARNYNLPDDIITNSQKRLSDSELSADALIEKLHKLESEINDERTKTLNYKKELEEEKNKFENLNKKLDDTIKSKKEIEGIEFLDTIQKYRKELSSKMKELQGLDLNDSRMLQQEIIDIENQVTKDVKETQIQKTMPGFLEFDSKDALIGDIIFVKPLGKQGKLIEIDTAKSMVTIMLGILKAKYSFSEVMYKKDQSSKSNTAKLAKKYSEKKNKKNSSPSGFTMQTAYNTIDLRGKHVDEAMNIFTSDVDKMYLNKIESIIIIHGHGTGALKDAVRMQLTNSSYVSSFRPGQPGEGGDGVTIARLSNN